MKVFIHGVLSLKVVGEDPSIIFMQKLKSLTFFDFRVFCDENVPLRTLAVSGACVSIFLYSKQFLLFSQITELSNDTIHAIFLLEINDYFRLMYEHCGGSTNANPQKINDIDDFLSNITLNH